jgi:hypothetical protein
MVYEEEAAVDDIYALAGTAMRHRVDVRAVVERHFPSHEAFVAWRDADDPFAAAVLENRDDLACALVEASLGRGGRHVDGSESVLKFDDHIDAERFRDWCRPE